MKKTQLALSIIAVAVMSGCSSINSKYVASPADTQSFLGNKPAVLQPFFKTLYEDGERNAVLNDDRLSLAAIENKNYDIAVHALDDAITRIDAVYSDNAAAEAARSKFNEEKVKDFKGESYERAMTYYYRGLLYLRAGEYDNARASFLGASLQDKFSEDQTYNQDFAVMDYLAGWSSMCMGDQSAAADHLRRAASINPSLVPLTTNPPSHLVIVETGYAPQKVRLGKYKEILKFTDNAANTDTTPHLFLGDTEIGNPLLGSDLLYQATTRGGRIVDSINAGKAEFKEGAETAASVGKVLAIGGGAMALAGNQVGGYVGSAGLLINLVSSGVAAATTPEADARTWEGLPKQIYFVNTQAPTDPTQLTIKLSKGNIPVSFPIQAQSGSCGFSWTHTPSVLQLIPATQLIPADTDDDRGPKNQAYRGQLKTQF